MYLQVDTFCDSIDKYVKGSGNSDDGGEFWPLVKKVSIRIPGCKMCQDGIVLVDLPGSGDSNAARDIIAQEVRVDNVNNNDNDNNFIVTNYRVQ